jgi:hypothetical protein
MSVRHRQVFFALALLIALAACSKAPGTASAPAAAPSAPGVAGADAKAVKILDLYRKLVQDKSWETASPVGQEIVAKYPGTPEAAEVQKSLPDTMAQATATATQRRLQRLWSYQTGAESGGTQNTASIYSGDSATGDRVRLILRRHSAWGQSAYLFGSGKGFDCKGTCALAVHFDDQSQKVKAYLPPTGEPALFISDDKALIARLRSTRKLAIDVTEKGKPPRTLVFEVGGFDPDKFPPLAKR